MAEIKKGSFTLPGEAGFESLTLKMAEKWGADVIRDSDGTKLSEDITKAGYGIYSTICVIRADNAWAKKNMDKLQQNFLMSEPVMAESDTVVISPLKGYLLSSLSSISQRKHWNIGRFLTAPQVRRSRAGALILRQKQ